MNGKQFKSTPDSTGKVQPLRAPKFYGWTLVGVLFGIYLINLSFPYYGASVINMYMAHTLNMDRYDLGLGFSVFSLSVGLISPFVALSVSRRGVRYTLCCGSLIITLGAILMAIFVTKAWHYVLIFGGLIAVGVSMGGLIPLQTGITHWFRRRRAMAMAIALSGGGIGSLISAPLLNKIVSLTNGNWQIGWLTVAVASVLSAILAAAGVKNKPSDIGQFPDGIEESQLFTDGDAVGAIDKRSPRGTAWTVSRAIRTRTLWLVIFACVAFISPFITCVAHGGIHLLGLGYSKEVSAVSVSLLIIFSTSGNLLGGILGDRIDIRHLWSIALFSILIGIIVLANAKGIVSVYVYALFFGGGIGISYVCMSTIISYYFGMLSFTPLMGIVIPVSTITSALAPALAGIIYDRQGSYALAFYGIAGITLLGALLILFARPMILRTRLSATVPESSGLLTKR